VKDSDEKKPDEQSRRCFLVKIGALATVCVTHGQGCVSDQGGDPDGSTDEDAGLDAGDPGSDPGRDAGDAAVAHYFIDPNRCDGCAKCVNDFTCPLNAIYLEGECRVYLDPEKQCWWQCRTFECLEKCPQEAIKTPGEMIEYNIHIDMDLCNCCGDCIPSCEVILDGVIARDSSRIAIIDPALCNDCGECVTLFTCPQTAIFFGRDHEGK
jgi:ferredoxin